MTCTHNCNQGRTCNCIENEVYASSTEPPKMNLDYTRGTMRRPTDTDHLQPNMCPPEDSTYWFWYLVGASIALTGLAYGLVWLSDRLING